MHMHMHMHIQARAGTGSLQGCSHSAQGKRKPDRMKLRYRAVRRCKLGKKLVPSWTVSLPNTRGEHTDKGKETIMEPLFRLRWRPATNDLILDIVPVEQKFQRKSKMNCRKWYLGRHLYSFPPLPVAVCWNSHTQGAKWRFAD